MRKNIALLATAAVGVLTLPAIALAQHEGHDGERGPKGPTTRAELQKDLAERFAAIDTNKDGVIVQAEADAHREAMKKQWAERRDKRHAEHFAAMDTNKDNQISKAEFDAFHAARAEKRADGDRKGGAGDDRQGHRHGMKGHWGGGDLIARADANKDGKVTLAEFSAKPLQWFDKADANKDGTVTPEERRAAWEKMRSEWKGKAAAKPGA